VKGRRGIAQRNSVDIVQKEGGDAIGTFGGWKTWKNRQEPRKRVLDGLFPYLFRFVLCLLASNAAHATFDIAAITLVEVCAISVRTAILPVKLLAKLSGVSYHLSRGPGEVGYCRST
jgi:hypothetical protein